MSRHKRLPSFHYDFSCTFRFKPCTIIFEPPSYCYFIFLLLNICCYVLKVFRSHFVQLCWKNIFLGVYTKASRYVRLLRPYIRLVKASQSSHQKQKEVADLCQTETECFWGNQDEHGNKINEIFVNKKISHSRVKHLIFRCVSPLFVFSLTFIHSQQKMWDLKQIQCFII